MFLDKRFVSLIKSLNLSDEQIKKMLKTDHEKIYEFLYNPLCLELEVSISRLNKIAKLFDIPFAYLFLDAIPKEKPLIPDLRGGSKNEDFSRALSSMIASSLKKQEWHKAYLIRNGYSQFLGDKILQTDKDIIQEAKTLTGFDSDSPKKDLKYFRTSLEENQFIVQQSGISKNNNRKPIAVEECRGYAIYDEYTPVIFINSKDRGEKGKIFTLFHELAHILLKSSGVSNEDFLEAQEIEYRCNEIAAEILMPLQPFSQKWDKKASIQKNVEALEKHFVFASRLAIATRALLKGLIDLKDYKIFKESQKFVVEKSDSEGGNYYHNVEAANGGEFTKKVIIDTINGYQSYRDALDMLDIKKLSVFDGLVKGLKAANA